MNIRDNIPYYIEHAIVAMAIMCAVSFATANVTAGASAGIAFYAGREIRDRQKLGRWDWPGLIAPVLACLMAWYLLR